MASNAPQLRPNGEPCSRYDKRRVPELNCVFTKVCCNQNIKISSILPPIPAQWVWHLRLCPQNTELLYIIAYLIHKIPVFFFFLVSGSCCFSRLISLARDLIYLYIGTRTIIACISQIQEYKETRNIVHKSRAGNLKLNNYWNLTINIAKNLLSNSWMVCLLCQSKIFSGQVVTKKGSTSNPVQTNTRHDKPWTDQQWT